MTQYIKGKDGKFAGSIGDGKDHAPAAAPTIPGRLSYPEDTPEYGKQLIDMFDRLNSKLDPNKRNLPTPDEIYARLEVDEGVSPAEAEFGDSIYDVTVAEADAFTTIGGKVTRDEGSDKYLASVTWLEERPEWNQTAWGKYDSKDAVVSEHATPEAALEAIKLAIAQRVPLEQEFTQLVAGAGHRSARDIAAHNGFNVSTVATFRSFDTGLPAVQYRSQATNHDIRDRDGYVSLRADGSFLGVVRYAGDDRTAPTPPESSNFRNSREAFDWVEHRLSQSPAS